MPIASSSDYLLDPDGTIEGKASKFDNIVAILKEIRSITDGDGNYLYRDYTLKITGYSLGGALAQLLLFTLAGTNAIEDLPHPLTAVTYASPAVGNKYYLTMFKDMEMKGIIRHIRITNEGDVVPCLLPQCGLSIQLYPEDRKAKVKYYDRVDFAARALRAIKFMDPAGAHLIETYAARLQMDINLDLFSKDVEDFYRESGALKRFDRAVKNPNVILGTKFAYHDILLFLKKNSRHVCAFFKGCINI